jgi:small Trp-rich protein
MAMWFLGIGVILLLMKFLEFGPVATWSWWIVLLPFGIALAWFEVVEPFFGLDKKKAHDDLEKVKQDRIKKGMGARAPNRR